MLVIISDLHFEEERSRNIPGNGTHPPLAVRRNIPLAAFQKIFTQLHQQAVRDHATHIDFILAGDIFDLNRTALWYQNNPANVRPYVSNQQVQPGSPLESKILAILEAIDDPATEPHAVLQSIRDLAQRGTYTNVEMGKRAFSRSYEPTSNRSAATELIPIHIHYIPGNHDRLANATPAIRRKVRHLLGVAGDGEPFPTTLPFPNERVLIRHGHEYDHYNFALDLRPSKWRQPAPIPPNLPAAAYDDPPFGDFVTVDIVSRISEAFRAHYGDEVILGDAQLRQLYRRSLEFDDLRPLRAILNYLLQIPSDEQHGGFDYDPATLWRKRVRPVIARLRDDLKAQNDAYDWLNQLLPNKRFDLLVFSLRLLLLPVWRWLPYWLIRWVSRLSLKWYKAEESKATFAARETAVRDESCLLLIAGHTHHPTVELIGHAQAGDQYYVDTGTWRHRIPTTPDLQTFGRIKALTYAVVYGPNEDVGNGSAGPKLVSLDHWSGFSKRWPE